MPKIKFNDNWFFVEQPLMKQFSYEFLNDNQKKWKHIDVPHDWLIYDTNALYRDSEGWYRKGFVWNGEQEKVSIYFDGVYQDSSFYVNGQLVGEWKNGYTAFEFEITDYLVLGKNEFFVRVRHQAPNSRWYSGAGIYRNIFLITRPNINIKTNGIYSFSKKNNDGTWQLSIETELESALKEVVKIEHTLFRDKKQILMTSDNYVTDGEKILTSIKVENPDLWSIENPNRYSLITKVISEAGLDEQETTIGFREFHIDVNNGFYLNDKYLKLKGVCLHHDLGALGSAFNKDALRRQFDLMKKMGVNAIRTAHNPVAEEFLDLADEMGFIIQSEFTDVWKHSKTKYDYARFFEEWSQKDVKSWIERDRNHPSVFMWSIGNEVYDTHGREDGMETAEYLIDLVNRFDPKKNAAVTFGSNYLLWENTQRVADKIKLVGYNYSEQLYEEHHKKYPDWAIYGSETLSTVASRGIYHFPLNQSILADDDLQCSALGNSSTSWGAKNVEWALTNDRDTKFSLGQFLWTGIDYIGEPSPYHTKNSYLGQVDTAGFPKDPFYVIKAMWQEADKGPMLHVFPYWDFSEDKLIDVRVVANTPKIALYLNEKLIETREVDLKNKETFVENWQIPYKKGTIRVQGLDEFGVLIIEKEISSFGDPVKIKLNPSKTVIRSKSEDLIFIEINVEDQSDIAVENANNRVQIEVNGAGRLIGIDNGDSTDYESYKGNNRKLFSGKLVAIIAANDQIGKIEVVAKSHGLEEARIVCRSVDEEIELGLANAYLKNEKIELSEEIPIRKIELSPIEIEKQKDNLFKLEAKTYPKFAQKQDLEWRLTDVKGINSQIVEFEVNGDEIEIRPISNGTFHVRCGVRNGKDHIDFYTSTEYTISNLKETLLDPYKEVSGGLVSRSNVELTNGNERGVATLRNETSYVIFDKVDFGDFGSDQITLNLFPLEANPFDIEIWQGYPEQEQSILVETVCYTKGSIWNTYQQERFKLKNKIKGIQTISFVFKQKVHIKDFKFEKLEKTDNEINILEYDSLYGDSYKQTETAIEEIGNNVTIVFNDLELKDDSFVGIKIYGQSLGRANTIQIKRTQGNTEEKTFVEFPETQEYEWHEFVLPEILGLQTLEFIFLPGSNFNFKAFKINKK